MSRAKLAACCAFLASSLLLNTHLHAAFTMLAGAPSISDGKSTVSIVVMNEESQSQIFHPADLLQASTTEGPVELKLISAPVDHLLQPGSFIRVNYVANKPLSTQALVSLDPARPIVRATPVAQPVSNESTQPTTSSDTLMAPPRKSNVERSLVETLGFRLKAHEPVYFLVGPDFPNAKFQFSMKYHLIGDEEKQDSSVQPSILSGLYLAYSQTSLWDLEGFSKPFFDSSYRPEVFYQFDGVEKNIEKWTDWDLGKNLAITVQTGLKHESNGRGDTPIDVDRGNGALDHIEHPSRSMNIVYARAIMNYNFADDYILKVAPSIHAYVFELDDENEDIADYRGYGDLKVVFGKKEGVQLAAIGRVGKDWDKGSIQLDLSFPISDFRVKDFDIYFHTQYFNGYGETLLDFNENDSSLRIGVSMVR